MNDRSRPLRSGLPVFAPTIGLREVLEASPDLVFSTDGWGRLAWASSTFEAFTGRRAKDCVGTPAMSLIVPADAPGVVRALLWLRRRGGTLQRTFGLRQVDGSTVPVETRFHFAETAEGERYLVGIARRRDATQVAVASPSGSGPAAGDRVGAL